MRLPFKVHGDKDSGGGRYDEDHDGKERCVADGTGIVEAIQRHAESEDHRQQRGDCLPQFDFRRRGRGLRPERSKRLHVGIGPCAGRTSGDGLTMAVSPCDRIINPVASIKQTNIIEH